ncbi:MAG: hypothetical protein N3F66_08675 [Spirochaetes bacterium]|nr:hypothetical protein [Spirochaetota bacterium]
MIETILYILSFGLGIAIFLYLLSLYHHIKEKDAKPPKTQPIKKAMYTIPQEPRSQSSEEPVHLKERTCPVCGSKLSKYEALYASKVVRGSTKILIYGCRYCYKPDEDPDKKKKSDI